MRKANSRTASLFGTNPYGRASRGFSWVTCAVAESFSEALSKLLHFTILCTLTGFSSSVYAGNYVPGSCQYGTNTPQQFCELFMGSGSKPYLTATYATTVLFDCSVPGCPYPNVDLSPGNAACWTYNQRGWVASCGIVACPAHASGTPCVCDTGYKLDAAGTSCVPNTLSLALTGGATTEPGTSLGFVATVTNQDKQPPANPVKVKISLKVDPTSGGHPHGDSTRPRGGIESKKCSSDETCWEGFTKNGVVNFDFNPTDASGTHTITATCEGCSNTETKPVDVKVEGLQQIPAFPYYALEEADPDHPGQTKVIGATANHSGNHYLLPAASQVLMQIAIKYHFDKEFKVLDQQTNKMAPPPILHVNDASLKWGGKFDIHGKWTGSHKEHKRGTSVDLRANENDGAIPPKLFSEFETLLMRFVPGQRAKGKFLLECTPNEQSTDTNPNPVQHNRIPENFCVSQADGSQDTYRHYHVRLLGEKK